jgi:hypothetical protein
LDQISPILDRMGSEAVKSSAEIERSDAQGKGFAGRLMVSRRYAAVLSSCADELEPIVRDYTANLQLVDPMTQLLFRIVMETGQFEDLRPFIESVRSMAEASIPSLESIDGFVAILRDNAKWSKDLRAPSRRIETALRQLTESREMFKNWLRLADETGI